MAFLTLEDCKAQCRVLDDADDALLSALRDAAEDAVIAQLNRDVFPDAQALASAQAALPDTLGAAEAAYQAALAAAAAMDDRTKAGFLVDSAHSQRRMAGLKAARIREGIVINASLLAAMRLMLGHLYANREAVVTGVATTELPMGVDALVRPYRLVMMP